MNSGEIPCEMPVVIPVFGREDVFGTVAFLRSQPYASRLRFIVIDNGNKPELSGRLTELEGEDCRVIRFTENRGGSAAYIAGVESARRYHPEAPYVWLLDDDAKPDGRTLPALVEKMSGLLGEDSRIASVGSTQLSASDPRRIVECGTRYNLFLGHAFPQLAGRDIASVGDRTLRIDYAAACSLLVNCAAVSECGFWEDVFIHFDDIEWGLRMNDNGWRNYATTASAVVHPEGGAAKSGAWICYFDSRNQLWLASKYGWVYVAAALIKDFLKDIRDRLLGNGGRIPYRKLAHADFKANIRRTRTEVIEAVNGGR